MSSAASPADIAAPYLSHLPMLSAAAMNTTGPVFELGAGLGSTLLLHGICGAARRRLVTLESDAGWMRRFMNYGRPWHEFRRVENFIDLPEYRESWGLAFVDHGLYEQRGHSIERLHHVPVVIVHDTCYPWLYDYVRTLEGWTYRWDWHVVYPQTTAVSMTVDVRKLFGGIGL